MVLDACRVPVLQVRYTTGKFLSAEIGLGVQGERASQARNEPGAKNEWRVARRNTPTLPSDG